MYTPDVFKNLSGLPEHCRNLENQFSLECVYQTICPQFTGYFINMGIGILIAFFIIRWLKWWFFRWGYKKCTYINNNAFWKYIGDLDILQNRIYWDVFIDDKLTKLMMGFIVVVIYLAKWGNFGT